jgi:hypothetical protein
MPGPLPHRAGAVFRKSSVAFPWKSRPFRPRNILDNAFPARWAGLRDDRPSGLRTQAPDLAWGLSTIDAWFHSRAKRDGRRDW